MPSILAPQITSALYLLCTPSIPATRQLRLRVYMASNHLLSQTCLDTRTNPRHPNCNPSTPSTTISTLPALLWNITSGASGWLFGLIMSRVPRNAKQQMHCSNNIARCILGNPSQLVQVAWCQKELASESSSNKWVQIINQIVRASLSLIYNFASMCLFHHRKSNLSRFGFM